MIYNSDTKKPKEKYHQELFLSWILTANREKDMISKKNATLKQNYGQLNGLNIQDIMEHYFI